MSATESLIEKDLIAKLEALKYAYRPDIRDRESLEANFRQKFEALNRVNLTNAEFARLRDEIITPDVYQAAKKLRETNYFQREDGTPLHYTLVNTKDWCKNDFEVINQLRINTSNSHHRYDVILLINGIPAVQIELKTFEVIPRKAIEQIVHYKNDLGNGYANSLLCFMQLFIVSNQSNTLYFANNKNEHFSFNADERFLPIYQLADEQNKKISHLHDFADVFLAKCTLGQMISRYMVLVASEQKLLVMRPYQIYAVKKIVDCIHQNRGNGYIWHTTGSGKTLTSFKASTLLKDNPDIEKCLFVVDRKDLDRQTREEFNRFQEGCVEENTNTETLVRRLLSEDYADKVIVTTIQKLGLALDETSKRNQVNVQKGKLTYKERLEPLRDKRIAFIFDECHRSQFGENHKAIKEFFPKAQMFGFTGTPIFDANSSFVQVDGNVGSFKTTQDLFENELHAYTITNAIEDKNVLSFHIDYFSKNKADDKKAEVKKPKKGEVPLPQAVINEIFAKHDAATNHRRFNAILATSSINSAIEYFKLFAQIQAQKQAEDESFKPLNIACVFSPPAQGNVEVQQLQEDLPTEKQDNQQAPEEKKAALIAIMDAYNKQFGTNHTIYEFDAYYQDVQKRIKDQQYANYPHKNKIDIVIVVDMLLTGFDSKYLNTLYVDKNLKHHGLIQAFSRTNRVLNDTKPWGNILDFRGQEAEVDAAIKLFSGKQDEASAREIWLVDPAPKVIEKLQTAVKNFDAFMQKQGVDCAPEQVSNLKGNNAKMGFINHFKEVQRFKTQLDQYTDLTDEHKETIEQLMPELTLRSFRGRYIETAQQLKAQQEATNPNKVEQERAPYGNEPDINQLDLELVLFASAVIDYDYIMGLIAKSTQADSGKQKMTRQQLVDYIRSYSNMMEDQETIIEFINSLPVGEVMTDQQIGADLQRFKAEKNNKALAAVANKHGLALEKLKTFVDGILNRMIFDGDKLSELFAEQDLGWKARTQKELALMEDMVPLLKKQAQGREISGLAAYE
jgi:type I restriction enzyme R subunit